MRYIHCVFLAAITMAGCVPYFVYPQAVQVEPAAPNRSQSPQTSKTDGYLRMRFTPNMQGLNGSWSDGTSRTHFKKLLVSVEVAAGASTTEVPLATFDITGSNAVSADVNDYDVGKLAYILLDTQQQPGLINDPNFTLHIRAVPETAADIADTVVKFANDTISTLAPGVSIVGMLGGSAATSRLMSGVLSSIQREAQAYKDKEWHKKVTISMRAALAQPNGEIAFVLLSEADQPPGATTKIDADTRVNAPPSAQPIPPLFGCDIDARTIGVIDHLCTKDAQGKLLAYTDRAWLTASVTLLDAPTKEVFNADVCKIVSNDALFRQANDRFDAFVLADRHSTVLDHFQEKIAAAHDIERFEGAARTNAYISWHRLGWGEDLSAWPAIAEQNSHLESCLADFEKTHIDAPLRSRDARAVQEAIAAINDGVAPDATKLYAVVGALHLAALDPGKRGDISGLVRDLELFEMHLYDAAFSNLHDAAAWDAALVTYKKCEYCRNKAETDRPKAVPAVAAVRVVENPGIESLLSNAQVDVSTLSRLRELDADVAMAKKNKSAQLPAIVEGRDAARDAAATVIAEHYKMKPETAKAFLAN